jgi:hydrogenase expression/formation protein HypC
MTGPDEDRCITCSDQAVPLTVVSVDEERGLALCDDGSGGRTTIEVALVAPVSPGELLLAHAGTAIARGAAA